MLLPHVTEGLQHYKIKHCQEVFESFTIANALNAFTLVIASPKGVAISITKDEIPHFVRNDNSKGFFRKNRSILIEEFLEAQLRGKNRSYILSFPDLIGESRKH